MGEDEILNSQESEERFVNQEIMPKLIQKAKVNLMENFGQNRIYRKLDDRQARSRMKRSRDCNRHVKYSKNENNANKDNTWRHMKNCNVLRVTSLNMNDKKEEDAKFNHF